MDMDPRSERPELAPRTLRLTRSVITTTVLLPAVALLATTVLLAAALILKPTPDLRLIYPAVAFPTMIVLWFWDAFRRYRSPDRLDLDRDGFCVTDRKGEHRYAWSQCQSLVVPDDPKVFGVLVHLDRGESYLVRDGFDGMNDYSMAALFETYRQAAAETEELTAHSTDRAHSGHDEAKEGGGGK